MTVPVFMCCSVVYGMRLRPAVALGNGAVGRSACHCVCCIARYIIIPSILRVSPLLRTTRAFHISFTRCGKKIVGRLPSDRFVTPRPDPTDMSDMEM